jgi:hypothetical protein
MEMAVTLEVLVETGIVPALDADRPPQLKTRGDRHGFAVLPLLLKCKAKG